MTAESLRAELVTLERELHNPVTWRDARRMAQLLHPDFVEFGRSGTVYSYADVTAQLALVQGASVLHSQGFQLRVLSDVLALLTYKSADVVSSGELERHTVRSSLWQRSEVGWQMLFHQGTAMQGFVRAAT